MGVFSEGDHPHDSKHSDSQLDASDSHKGGGISIDNLLSKRFLEGKSRTGNKKRSYNSPKKSLEPQQYPQPQPQPMYPPNMSNWIR